MFLLKFMESTRDIYCTSDFCQIFWVTIIKDSIYNKGLNAGKVNLNFTI